MHFMLSTEDMVFKGRSKHFNIKKYKKKKKKHMDNVECWFFGHQWMLMTITL